MLTSLLEPTPDQTFEIGGTYDFAKTAARAAEWQRTGRVEEACNERFRAFQRLAGLLPDDEEVVLAWNHRNTRAALELLHASAVDHFLIDDFEMSAAMLELLLELDPEDHLEGIVLLAFDYVALDERELFDETIDGVPEKSAARSVLTLWSAFRREGALPEGALRDFRSRFGLWFEEFTAEEHPADDAYLKDIESERPSLRAQARELWLRTENLWALRPDFIGALRAAARG